MESVIIEMKLDNNIVLNRVFKMAYKLITLFLFMTLFSGCHSDASNDDYTPQYSKTPPLIDKKVYILGIYAGENPNRTFEMYQPMVDYINVRLKSGKLRIEASRNLPSFNAKLFSGYYDFSLANPYSVVRSTKKGYRIFGKMGDDDIFKGLVIVRKDSQINTIDDLRGKVISYPDATALAAAIMPQWYFHEHKLDVEKDIKNSYVGSQESSIMNVYLKKSDAACTWPPPWNNFIEKRPEMAKKLMVKWETPSLVNNGLVVRKDIPSHVVKEIGDILFTMHTNEEGKTFLHEQGISRYEKAEDKTYGPVRDFLKKFEGEVHPIKDAE